MKQTRGMRLQMLACVMIRYMCVPILQHEDFVFSEIEISQGVHFFASQLWKQIRCRHFYFHSDWCISGGENERLQFNMQNKVFALPSRQYFIIFKSFIVLQQQIEKRTHISTDVLLSNVSQMLNIFQSPTQSYFRLNKKMFITIIETWFC